MDEPERLFAMAVEGGRLRRDHEGEFTTVTGLVLSERGSWRRQHGDQQEAYGDAPDDGQSHTTPPCAVAAGKTDKNFGGVPYIIDSAPPPSKPGGLACTTKTRCKAPGRPGGPRGEGAPPR